MRVSVARVCAVGLGLTVMALSMAGTLHAQPTAPVPEIDGSSIPAAVGILSAGVLMLRARLRK
jgi:hypothetical protein